MRSGLAAKVRLVKCPKCREILPELPDVPIYECGGCGTRLQAKIRNNNVGSTVQTNNVDHASEDNASSSPYHEATHCSAGDFSSDQKNGRGQIESRSSSNEATHHSSDDSFSDQNNGRVQIESSDHSEQLTSANLSHEQNNGSDQITVRDFSYEEQNNGSDQITARDLSYEEQNNGSNQITAQDDDGEHLGGVNLANEDQNSGSDENAFDNEQPKCGNTSNEGQNNGTDQCEPLDWNIEQYGIFNEVGLSTELSHLENKNLSPLAGANSEVEVGEESLPVSEDNAKPNTENASNSNIGTSSNQKLAETNGSTSIVTVQRPARESISSDILISSPSELMEQPEKSVHHNGFVRVRSTDTFETTDFINPSSELSGTLIDLSKSPTTRSYLAYYDDGVSSYEGTDDQLPGRHKCRFKNVYKPQHADSDERSRRENSSMDVNLGTKHKLRNCESIVSDKTHYTAKYSTLDQDESLEGPRFGKPLRNWRRLESEEYSSQLPFYRMGSMDGYESSSPSNQWPGTFHENSSFYSHEKYTEQEKRKLLRMVYELQEQLNKACSLNENANGRVSAGVNWEDHYIPTLYGHKALQHESFCNLHYPRYPQRFREESSWSQQGRYSRIPFSGEATNGRYHVGHSLCCCSLDWQHSVQLPPGFHHNKGYCKVHSGANFYNSYGSWPSSPQKNVNAEFHRNSRGTKSEEQRRRDHEVMKYTREKCQLVKRHLRPIAGGAPFITCRRCLKQLQLPADFLLFKRRCHQLRCGACSELLKFSLLNSKQLVPYAPTAKAPPPSEVDEFSDAIDKRNLASTSYVRNCPHSDPVSCSDDYGLSISKSCSTDRDPIPYTYSHAVHSNAIDRKVSYGSPKCATEGKKFVLHKTQSKFKSHVGTYESTGQSCTVSKSEKVYSEIEEQPRGGGSPLHRLMGYSSPSELINSGGPSV